MSESEHAVFVLPTQEDVLAVAEGRNPDDMFWRVFETARELTAYKAGIDAIEDENDELASLVRLGRNVFLGRGGIVQPHELESEAVAEAFRQGVEDAEGVETPLLIGREDGRFSKITKISSVQPYTFEQFQATKFECADIGAALRIDGFDDEDDPIAGNIYLCAVWIERMPEISEGMKSAGHKPGGKWHLLIENSTEIGDDLEKFERELYKWAVSYETDLPTPAKRAELEAEMIERVRLAAEARKDREAGVTAAFR
jgi:hypothetical protein